MSSFSRAAFIVSARHLNGSVVCKAADTLPFLLREGQMAHFVPPTFHGPRSARVLSVGVLPTGAWEVTFEGVNNIDIAENLVGSYCLVAEDELPVVSVEEDAAVLHGYTVWDNVHGNLGKVEAILVSPAQTTLDIMGAYGQVLIPLVDEYVTEVDEETRVVYTHIPESLLVLNVLGQRVGDTKDTVEGGEI